MFRSSNPALKTLEKTTQMSLGPRDEFVADRSQVMTVDGTVNKTGLLLLIAMAVGAWTWQKAMAGLAMGDISSVQPLIWIGLLGGFGVAIATLFKPEWSPITTPLYAALEGLALGAISALFEARYPGIVASAMFGTFAVLGAMLLAYKTGLIKVTDTFRKVIFYATGGIMLYYLLALVLGFFGVQVPLIHESGPMGIAFSLFVIVVAAMNLALDFDFIEKASAQGAPKYMEWFGAFTLLMTLVWLYIEMLRLLSKLRDN
jgi:uncharacterized YccA/Bax inhibitor family protein